MIYSNARAIIERTIEDRIEVVVQWRNKIGEECYEFPGGSVEEFESLFDALKREVKEETGLDVIEATGQDNCIKTDGGFGNFEVECFKPYSVYQTTRGGFDSMGVHFICKVTGEMLSEGDATKDIKWIGLDELKNLAGPNGLFLDIDRAAALFYLKEKGIL